MVRGTLNQKAVIRGVDTIAQNVNYAVKIDYVLPLLPPEARPAVAGRVSSTTQSFEDVVRNSETSLYRTMGE